MTIFSLNGSYFWQKVKDAHAIKDNTIINAALLRNQGYELGAAYKQGGFKFRLGVDRKQTRNLHIQ